MAGNGRLTAKQRKFVSAMMTARTVGEAAKVAGISERTARRYLRNEAVRAALSQALDDALGSVTRQVVQKMTRALGTLEQVHADKLQPASARVSAARAILEAGPKLREAVDLAERVTRLEERLSEGR
jgi:phage terminase small subunit